MSEIPADVRETAKRAVGMVHFSMEDTTKRCARAILAERERIAAAFDDGGEAGKLLATAIRRGPSTHNREKLR